MKSAYKIKKERSDAPSRTLSSQQETRDSGSIVGCHRGSKVCGEMTNTSTLRTNVMTPKCCVDNLSKLMVEAAAFFHKHDLHCWLDWGSLLGVVRDGKLLAWDRDVDFGFHAHAENAILEAFANDGRPHRADNGDIGFVLETGLFYVPNWGQDYAGNRASIPRIYFSETNRLYADMYPYYQTKKGFGMGRIGPSTYDIEGKHILSLRVVNWKGHIIYVPSETEEYLVKRYGEDWMVPDPDFYQKYPPGSAELMEKINQL